MPCPLAEHLELIFTLTKEYVDGRGSSAASGVGKRKWGDTEMPGREEAIKEIFNEVFALWKEEILSMLPTGSDTQGYTTLHETLKLLDSAALEQLEERLLVLFEQATLTDHVVLPPSTANIGNDRHRLGKLYDHPFRGDRND